MKGLMFQQQLQQPVVEENMSNLTCASGEASVSSGNRTEIGTSYSQQYFAPPPPQTQPAKKKRNLPGNPGLSPSRYINTASLLICVSCLVLGYFYFLYWGSIFSWF